MRFSVGAVEVRSGNFTYFDNTKHKIAFEHIAASGSLPPGFPATKIGDEYFWDGGLISNTPLEWVLGSRPRRDTLAFQVDLWHARGELPKDMIAVEVRQKEIIYSSRNRAATDRYRYIQKLRIAFANLLKQMPGGRKGGYSHCMFLNDDPPIAGGRELWGFPKKLAQPTLRAEIDTLVGTLDYGPVRVATGTMGYKHKLADHAAIKASLEAPNFLLKIIPHVDGSPRICELVEYYLEDIDLKGAWTGPGALDLHAHALAPVAELPVLEILSATHIIADLTLGLGKVIYDYLR